MSSAWLLPEHIADVLPAEARRLEDLRRTLLEMARSYGFELVMPPLLEHLESLLSGTGRALDLRTFKLVDQLSGRSLGIRADATPQVARIDAHLLNRQGVTRLCYCGPVLHTRPQSAQSTREPLQLGAEIYGHAGLEADLEVQDLALDGLRAAGLQKLVLDLADARIVRGVLAGLAVDGAQLNEVVVALAAKDIAMLRRLAAGFPAGTREALLALPGLYGDATVLDARAARCRNGRSSPLRWTTWPSWPAMWAAPIPMCRWVSTWPTWAAMPTTRAPGLRCMHPGRPTRCCAVAGTTRWVRCSAATARRSVFPPT